MPTQEIAPDVRRACPEPGPSTRDVVPGRGHPRCSETRSVRRCRILLVDNSPVLIRAIEVMLASIDWIRVIGSASSGGMALEQIEQLEPDMVLLDLAMPGMDGLEVIGRLAERDRRPRVIVMTAHVDEDYRRVAAAAGADGFLIKADLWTDLLPLIDALRPWVGGKD